MYEIWMMSRKLPPTENGARLQLILLYNLIIHYNTSYNTWWTWLSSEAFPHPYMAWESF